MPSITLYNVMPYIMLYNVMPYIITYNVMLYIIRLCRIIIKILSLYKYATRSAVIMKILSLYKYVTGSVLNIKMLSLYKYATGSVVIIKMLSLYKYDTRCVPSGTPSGSGHISPYIPPLLIMRIHTHPTPPWSLHTTTTPTFINYE